MILTHYGINTSMIPSGGWRYEEERDGKKVRIPFAGEAATSDQLIEMVRDFRATNGIPQGDPAFDVAEYIRRVSPQNNRWRRSREMPEKIAKSDKTPSKAPLIERIGNWLRDIAPRRPKLVGLYDANERVPICQGCRHNVKWATKCLPCIVEVKSIGINVRQQLAAPGPDELMACRLHDLYLPTAVFIDIDHLPEKSTEAPEICFLRNPMKASASTESRSAATSGSVVS